MTIFNIISLFGGLALFLYGMRLMGDGLKRGSSDAFKSALEKVTNNPLVGFLLGLGVTAVIQSSTATIVLTSGLVGAGIMSLHQSIGVILGANVGTTVTGQIIRLLDVNASDTSLLNFFKPSTLAPLAAIIGILFIMAVKGRKSDTIGSIAMGFGILFTGLLNMTAAVSPLSESESFANMFYQLSGQPVLGFLLGAALGTAGCTLLVHGHALCVHPAGHVAQPLPDLSRSEVKNVQADAERQHQHDEVCCRPAAEQQQVAAQHRTQCAAGQPRLITVLVAGRHHLEGRQPLRLDVGKHDHRAACKHEPQRQLADVRQQILAPRVQHGQAAHRCTQHKTAAAKQAKQHLMQRFPHRVAFHKGKAHQQKPRKQGPKPCRQALFRAFFARR